MRNDEKDEKDEEERNSIKFKGKFAENEERRLH